MLKNKIVILQILLATLAFDSYGSNSRVQEADSLISTDHSKAYSLPSSTDTLVGRASTDTLSNKSLSGASNTFTSIPGSAVSSGQVGLANGGTNASLSATNGALTYSNASSLALSSVGSSGQVVKSGGAAAPTFGEVGTAKFVYVDKSGNDSTCVVGSINRPCLTIAAAIGKCPSLSSTNQCVVGVGPGSFNEGTNLNLKGYVHIVGSFGGNSLGLNNQPTKIVTDNGIIWTGTTVSGSKTGITNANVSSTNGIDFDVTYPGVASELHLENVEATGVVNFTSNSGTKFLEISNSYFADAFNVTGLNFDLRHVSVMGELVVDSGILSATGTMQGVFSMSGNIRLHAATNPLTAYIIHSNTAGIEMVDSAVTLFIDSASVPQAAGVTNTGGGTLSLTTYAPGIGFVPTNSGDWLGLTLFSVQEALDKIGSGNFSTQGYQLNTSGSQPTCAVGFRGLLWGVQGGTGVSDDFQVCQKNAADAYVWASPGSGGSGGGSIYGTAKITGCASEFTRTSGSFGALSTQSGCSYAVTGNATAPSTQIAAFKFASLPAGTYHAVYIGNVELAGAVNDAGQFIFHDGTNAALETNRFYYGGNGSSNSIEGTFIYGSTQTNVTISVQARSEGGGSLRTAVYGTTSLPGVFILYKYQ